MTISEDALIMLKETSRTFFIPISRLPAGLQDAVMSGYLCMRAIDEVEDHPRLDNRTKAMLLRSISHTLQTTFDAGDFTTALGSYQQELPEVTLRVGDWALLAPPSVAPRVWEATATMADRMAQWADNAWTIRTEEDPGPLYVWGSRLGWPVIVGSMGLVQRNANEPRACHRIRAWTASRQYPT